VRNASQVTIFFLSQSVSSITPSPYCRRKIFTTNRFHQKLLVFLRTACSDSFVNVHFQAVRQAGYGSACTVLHHFLDFDFELRFYVPLDKIDNFSDVLYSQSFGQYWTEKLNLTTKANIHLEHKNITQNKHKKLKPGLVASYDFQPGNETSLILQLLGPTRACHFLKSKIVSH